MFIASVVFQPYYSEPHAQRNASLYHNVRWFCTVYCLANDYKSSNNEVSQVSSLERCDPIDSLSVSTGAENTGVTNFVSESCEAVDVLGTNYKPSAYLVEQPILQDLKEYFRRPRFIGSGSLSAVANRLAVWNVTEDAFNTYFPGYRTRLLGVFGWRFRMVFTLQVAATPFHQGMVVLNWQYQAADVAVPLGQYPRSSQNFTCTNIPHVRLDLAETTMVQLHVPYLNVREYFQVADNSGDEVYGLLALNNFGVPVVAGMEPPSYTLYVHLEDLELIGAYPDAVASITVQGGKPVTRELEHDAYPFSSSLYAASGLAKWVSRGVPAISSLATTSSWLLGRAAGVVRYLGYAKPQVLEPVQRMNNIQSVAEHNVDLPSSTVMVAPFSTNALRPHPQFGATDVDEMALPFVLNQWSQIYRGSIAGIDPRGMVEYVCSLSPSTMWYRRTNANSNKDHPYVAGNTYNAFQPSSVFFASSMFRHWRGGFKFRFTFFKNKFHNGRVILTFTPGLSTIAINTTSVLGANNLNPFGHSLVFDFKDSNVVEFEVPYTSTLPLLNFFESFGNITMCIVDPVKSSAVVSPNVDYIVEVKAMPGFELVDPQTIRYPTHVGGTAIQAGAIIDNYSSEFLEQTAGEAFNSFKQLMMIPKIAQYESIAATAGDVGWTLPPWYYQPQLQVTFPTNTNLPPNAFSFAGNISKCYLYAKGSTDYHVQVMNQPSATTVEFMRTPNNNNIVSAAGQSNTVLNTPESNNVRMVSVGDKPVHVRVPSYQRTTRFLTSWLDSVQFLNTAATRAPQFVPGTVAPVTLPFMRRRSVNPEAAPVNTGFLVSHCAGDDAACAHYMGPPPCWLPSAAATGQTYDIDSRVN